MFFALNLLLVDSLLLVFVLFALLLGMSHLLLLLRLIFNLLLDIILFFLDLLLLSGHINADDSLPCLDTRKRLKSFQVIILTDLVDSFDKFKNIPATNNPVSISCQQIVTSLIVRLFHIFNPAFMSFEMNAVLVASMLPYLDLSFLC